VFSCKVRTEHYLYVLFCLFLITDVVFLFPHPVLHNHRHHINLTAILMSLVDGGDIEF
jgi:hypothetical protein